MNSLKGLASKTFYSEDSLLPFNKRHYQIQKTLMKIFQFYRSISRIYTTYSLHLEKTNERFCEQISINGTIYSKFYSEITSSMKDMNLKIQTFSTSEKADLNKLLTYCNDYFDTLRNVYMIFKQKIKVFQKKQDEIVQLAKKYNKDHRSMINMMESYKNSFSDVKLIYNLEQKNKRYNNCNNTYELLKCEYKDLHEKTQILQQIKKSLKQSFENLKNQFINLNKSLACQFLNKKSVFCQHFLELNKQICLIVSQFAKTQKNHNINTIFQKFRLPFTNPEYFECKLNEKQCLYYPSFIKYFGNFKPQHAKMSKKLFVLYFKQMLDDIKDRTQFNQFLDKQFSGIHAYVQGYFIKQLRQSMVYYQKIKKNITCYFCQQVQQSINDLFVLLAQIKQSCETNMKPLNQHVNNIKQCLSEQSKLLKLFQSQFKNVFYQLFGKKQLKMLVTILDQNSFEDIKFEEKQLILLRPELSKKVQFLRHFIEGFIPKFNQNSQKLKNSLTFVFIDLKNYLQNNVKTINNFIQKKKTLHQNNPIVNIQELQKKEHQFFVNTIYDQILISNPLSKLSFDGQFEPIQEFKRIKRPKLPGNKEQIKTKEQKNKQMEQNNKHLQSKQINSVVQNQSSIHVKREEDQLSSAVKKIKIKDKFFSMNYKQFIMKKTKFIQDEEFLDSFACGIADNIIVSGRLYLTTLRLMFHSNFNSKNIFFGSTFIQIPKTDIKKIQKRYNAVIFDNSLSITTVNGQMFFTSFVSRNSAFDLIIKTFDLNNNQAIFVSQKQIGQQEQVVQTKDFNLQIVQEDDMNEAEIPKRLLEIQPLLGIYQYESIGEMKFNFPALTAVKYFKIFDSGQEIIYKKKLYKSFSHYFQQTIRKNKKIQISQWQPNIISFLNPCNLKTDAPIKCSRQLHYQTPTPNSGLPFMPKFVLCEQKQDLYFVSKDKYIIQSHLQNSKAPYTDSFYLKYKKEVQTVQEGKVKVQHSMHMVFVKKVFIRSMIETRIFEESRQNIKDSFQNVKKQLNSYLQKPKKKQQQNAGQNKKIQQIQGAAQKDQENQNQIQNTTNEELSIVKAQLLQMRNKGLIQQKLLIASLLANLLLIIYLAFA